MQLFVSTHSSNFLMGCMQSGVSMNIVRLTHLNKSPTARILPNNDVMRFMRNPLLRSVNVLSSLFYEFVVVTEADTDRAFYQEINNRILQYEDNKGIPNCLFLNAQNKQTIRTIIRPLRELGIPVVGIFDIDIIKLAGKEWTDTMKIIFLPDAEIEPLNGLRANLDKKFNESRNNMKTDGGVKILKKSDQEALRNLFARLSAYGLFFVLNGELESWLKDLGVKGHGPKWVIEIINKMGENPNDKNFLMPGNGYVWKFISDISQWFLHPQKKRHPGIKNQSHIFL